MTAIVARIAVPAARQKRRSCGRLGRRLSTTSHVDEIASCTQMYGNNEARTAPTELVAAAIPSTTSNT